MPRLTDLARRALATGALAAGVGITLLPGAAGATEPMPDIPFRPPVDELVVPIDRLELDVPWCVPLFCHLPVPPPLDLEIPDPCDPTHCDPPDALGRPGDAEDLAARLARPGSGLPR